MSSHLMEDITPVFARPEAIVNNASNWGVGFESNQALDSSPTTGVAMAKRLSEREVASVRLLVLEVSEDELTVLAAALTTLLKEQDDQAIEAQSGASRDEVNAILGDLHTFLKQPTRQSMTS